MARKIGSYAQTTGPQVKAAALKLFAQSGYAAVSMRQIASEVGMQAGALYLYTPDKQTLLFDLMREHMEDLLAAWAAAKQGASPPERLEAFTRFHIRYHLDRTDLVFIAYMELRNLEPDNFAVIQSLRARYEQELERILRDGNSGGLFKIADARLSTMAIIAMLTGMTSWYREDGRLSRDRIERIYWNMVRRTVGA